MSSITGITGNQHYTHNSANSGSSELGKDAFLQLLVTQLRYQDPLNPADSSEFAAQMAQFSALEQTQNLNAGLEKLIKMQGVYQLSLLGKEIVAEMDDGSFISGQVSAIEFNRGVAMLNVGGYAIGFDSLVWVQSGEGHE
jgi:flagellar basal-body rod modification protein FlgD